MPGLSIIIPTCCTKTSDLEKCLLSAAGQTLPDTEIIVVDDNSLPGEQRLVKQTVKSVKKQKLPNAKNISILSHGRNKGLVASRRDGVLAANGTYITFLDSDDSFSSPEAMEKACSLAQGFDILQFCAKPVKLDSYILEDNKNAYRLIENPQQGDFSTEDSDSFALEYLTTGKYCLFLWGKLFRRDVFEKAMENMPLMNCFMAEDLLFSYFVSRQCKSYRGIPDNFYNYSLGEGISTSAKAIDTMERWEKLCTPASVFTAIMYDLQENPLSASEAQEKLSGHFTKVLTHFALRNFKLLQKVTPELRDKAYEKFIDYWGEDTVSQIVRHLK